MGLEMEERVSESPGMEEVTVNLLWGVCACVCVCVCVASKQR